MELNTAAIKQWMHQTNESIQENKDYLTELDQKIGDGDHGINMARGFQAVVDKLKEQDYDTVSDVLKDTAMTLMSKVGGASGPLFGTAFLKFSTAVKGQETIDAKGFAKGIREAAQGIMDRGKAQPEEKTLVDVWLPTAQYLEDTSELNAEAMKQTAKEAMEKTKDMVAAKGRAAYFKEKSAGHIDPGAASSYYLFAAFAKTLREER